MCAGGGGGAAAVRRRHAALVLGWGLGLQARLSSYSASPPRVPSSMALHDIMVHAYGLAASTQISYLSVQATQLGNTALFPSQ